MTLKQVLERARGILSADGIEDAPLKSELLLRHVLGLSRVQLYLDLYREMSLGDEQFYWQMINRCVGGEPTAYITHHREFYGLDFYVVPSVLIPRPESELLVDEALKLAQHHQVSTVAEIGTGSGAIAISLAVNLPRAKIYATDISASALGVARLNCEKHGLVNRVEFLQGDMLEPLPGPVDLIIANLPYVRQSDLTTELSISHEPPLALDGGADGMEKIRRLCLQVRDKLTSAGHLLLEIGQGQREAVTALLRDLLPETSIEVTPDLLGIDRVVSVSLSRVSSSCPSPSNQGYFASARNYAKK
jgi:release factor glutamine methyltransferase